MARIVRHHATGPIKVEPAQFPRDEQGNLKPMWVCACGITKTPPFCDRTHKACRQEEPGHVYEYDPATSVVVSKRPE